MSLSISLECLLLLIDAIYINEQSTPSFRAVRNGDRDEERLSLCLCELLKTSIACDLMRLPGRDSDAWPFLLLF